MDKNVFEVKSIYDNDDKEFWKNKSYSERLDALEQLRRIMFNYDSNSKGLQRVLTITKLKEN